MRIDGDIEATIRPFYGSYEVVIDNHRGMVLERRYCNTLWGAKRYARRELKRILKNEERNARIEPITITTDDL